MSERKEKKRWFAKHAKSSALMVSLIVHVVLILVAISFVAVTVIQKDNKQFEAKPVNRPRMQLKKLQVPVNIRKKKTQAPKLRKRIVVTPKLKQNVDIKLPEITGVKGGLGSAGDGLGGAGGIGFSIPEIEFFGTKAKGEKVVFVVHFGPATIHQGRKKNVKNQPSIEYNNPFTRMTGLTIRNRLEDLINEMPDYTLFNVIAYYAGNASAINPTIMPASAENKQKVMDWMEPVNPLEGDYNHCLSFGKASSRIDRAKRNWPTRVDDLPFYSLKWAYPYVVPKSIEQKYAPDAPNGFMHWGRGVVWAMREQKADTIFILTTNYIDGWSAEQKDADGEEINKTSNDPRKMAIALKKMVIDIYGPNKRDWPTLNVVVLAPAGKDSTGAHKTLNEQYGPIYKGFRGDASVIENIRNYMTDEELKLYSKYQSQYENK